MQAQVVTRAAVSPVDMVDAFRGAVVAALLLVPHRLAAQRYAVAADDLAGADDIEPPLLLVHQQPLDRGGRGDGAGKTQAQQKENAADHQAGPPRNGRFMSAMRTGNC